MREKLADLMTVGFQPLIHLCDRKGSGAFLGAEYRTATIDTTEGIFYITGDVEATILQLL